jgi:hypothetical protein
MDMEPRNEVIKDTIGEMETKSDEEVAIEELKASIEVQNQIVYVERPVYVPATESTARRTTGLDSVRQSTEDGTIKPSDYSHAARIYDYDADQVTKCIANTPYHRYYLLGGNRDRCHLSDMNDDIGLGR